MRAHLYLAVRTRTNISFAISAFDRSHHSPSKRHKNMVHWTFRCFSAALNISSISKIQSQNFNIIALSDPDWAGCSTTRNSAEFVIKLNKTLSCWNSIRLSIISLSPAEVECIFILWSSKELGGFCGTLWWFSFKNIFHHTIMPTIPLYISSSAALSMAVEKVLNSRTKHIDVLIHHAWNLGQNIFLSIQQT